MHRKVKIVFIWAHPGLFFVYFRPFHITNQLQIESQNSYCVYEREEGMWRCGCVCIPTRQIV